MLTFAVMTNLVHELQQAALDEDTRVGALLRRALVVASKLGVEDFATWARNELDGYGDQDTVPEYRYLRGKPMVWNPYHGWQDLHTQSAQGAEKLSVMHMNGGVDTLEDSQKGTGGTYIISYNPKLERLIMDSMNHQQMKPAMHASETAMRGILGRIRNVVLEWTIKLEKVGVVGVGMTFSPEERTQAASSTSGR